MLTVMLFVRQMKMALTVDEKRRNCCIKRKFGVLGKSAKVSSSERERWRYRGCGGQCGSIMAGWRNLLRRKRGQGRKNSRSKALYSYSTKKNESISCVEWI